MYFKCSDLQLFSVSSKENNVHLIFPGESALETIHKIEEGDYVIGCNLACVLSIKFDLIVIERYGDDCYSDWQYELCKWHINNNDTQIVIKNIWQKSIREASKLPDYKERSSVLLDVPYRGKQFLSPKILSKWFDIGLDNRCFTSAISSVFVMLQMGQRFRPEKIIIHGVDFGGKYLWENEATCMVDKVARKITLQSSTQHETEKNKVKFSDLISGLVKQVSERGTIVLAADENGKLSKIMNKVEA